MNEAQLRDAQGVSFTGADSAQIDKYIEGSYVDAWRRCAKIMPRAWLGNKILPTTSGIITHVSILGSNPIFHVNDIINLVCPVSGTSATIKVATITPGAPVTITLASITTQPSTSGGYYYDSTSKHIFQYTGSWVDLGTPSQYIQYEFSGPYTWNGTALVSGNATSNVGTILTATVLSGGVGYEDGDNVNNVNGTALFNITAAGIPILYTNLSDGTGYILLPSDFYLLTSLKMVGWKKSVREASLANERTDNIQSNIYTRGSSIRPVVLIDNKVVNGSIAPVLTYYSLPAGLPSHTVEEAIYVPTVEGLETLGDNDDLGLDMRIIEPLAYLSASSVFTIFEKYDISKALDLKAESMMPGLISVKGTTVTNKQ